MNTTPPNKLRLSKAALIVASALFIVGCDSSDNNDGQVTPAANPNACAPDASGTLFAMAAKTNETGVVQVRSEADGALLCSLPATTTDTHVTTHGKDIYQIGRFNQNFLAKYSLDDVKNDVYQISVNGDDTNANPYQVIFASDKKAYVIRRGGNAIWIVNPTVTEATAANFKIGELDLSAYGDAYPPHATAAKLINGKLFVMMERLTGTGGYSPIESGYVAVFDTATDTEIDTGKGTADGLMGIRLGVTNPTAFQYEEENDLLYLIGRGNVYGNSEVSGDPYAGGVVTVDPESYEASLLVDDGTASDNIDFFTGLTVVSASKAYLQTYAGWQNTTLHTFNATTGVIDAGAVANQDGVDITTMAESPDGELWLGVNDPSGESDPKIEVLDVNTDASVRSFDVDMVPINFSFIEQ